MTIRRENSASNGRKRNEQADLAAARENFCELLRRNYLELCIRAIAGLLVGPPPAEVRHVTEAASLHVLVSDFHNQFGPQGLPGQILALAPTALPARHALAGFTSRGLRTSPALPRVTSESILPIGLEEFCQLAALLRSEAGANADMLQRTDVIEEAQEQRADQSAIAFFVPTKSRHDTIALALVFDFEHGAFVRFVDSRRELGHHAVQTSTL